MRERTAGQPLILRVPKHSRKDFRWQATRGQVRIAPPLRKGYETRMLQYLKLMVYLVDPVGLGQSRFLVRRGAVIGSTEARGQERFPCFGTVIH